MKLNFETEFPGNPFKLAAKLNKTNNRHNESPLGTIIKTFVQFEFYCELFKVYNRMIR